jgi:hypothetical protein
VASSLSARAISNSWRASSSWEIIATSRLTVPSSAFFSLPSSWARFWSFQTAGSASACSTSLRRFCLPSRSKIPPQLGGPRDEVLEQSVDLVEAFGFH